VSLHPTTSIELRTPEIPLLRPCLRSAAGLGGGYARRVESVVAVGVWLYDGVVPTTVTVVMLDYDFWHAVAAADGDLEPGELPQLNEEGRLYYLRHRPGWPEGGRPFWPDSEGFYTLADAVAAAESTLPCPVVWQ
jgi:hypothetical protein